MAGVGPVATQLGGEVKAANGDVGRWFERYTAPDGWYRLDQAQRRLEAWMTKLDDTQERPLGVVRRAYEDTCHLRAERFAQAWPAPGGTVPRPPHPARGISKVRTTHPRPPGSS